MSTVDDLMALVDEAYCSLDGRLALRAALESALRAEYGRGRRQGITDVHDKLRVEHEQAAEPVAWRNHVEQRLLTWRQSFVNRSGDRLALDDFMDKESLADLIDFVCDEYASPPKREPLTEERCVALAREFSGNPVPAIASPELWFLRGIRAAERAHGIGDE